MVPASFAESNHVLGRPAGMTDEQCAPLSVFVNGEVVVSCWKLTAAELDEVIRTGRVWLVMSGLTMPPVVLATNSPFKAAK